MGYETKEHESDEAVDMAVHEFVMELWGDLEQERVSKKLGMNWAEADEFLKEGWEKIEAMFYPPAKKRRISRRKSCPKQSGVASGGKSAGDEFLKTDKTAEVPESSGDSPEPGRTKGDL